MKNRVIDSDQLNKWSANERFHSDTANTSSGLGSTTRATPTLHPARFPHRALQALRQSGMPLSTRTWPRSQVLPFGQSGRRAPRDGLRPRRLFPASRRVSGQLSERAATTRKDLQSQSRTPTPSRSLLILKAHAALASHLARSRFSGDDRRQFSPIVAPSPMGSTGATSTPGALS